MLRPDNHSTRTRPRLRQRHSQGAKGELRCGSLTLRFERICLPCADGWMVAGALRVDKPLHSLQVRVSDSSAQLYGSKDSHSRAILFPRYLPPSIRLYPLNAVFHFVPFAAHVHHHLGAACVAQVHSFSVCPRHVMQLGARTCTPSTIDPACSPTTLLTTTSPPPAAHYNLRSPSFTVHHSRQSMSRGGKLAPEVNR
jgi:hypothetical protein